MKIGQVAAFSASFRSSDVVGLKTEWVYFETFKTREQARDVIFDYIEVFYNRRRRHSANGNLAPLVYEETQKAA